MQQRQEASLKLQWLTQMETQMLSFINTINVLLESCLQGPETERENWANAGG